MENCAAILKHEPESGTDTAVSSAWGRKAVDHRREGRYDSISVWKNISRFWMFFAGRYSRTHAKHLNEYVIPSGVKGMPALRGWRQRNSSFHFFFQVIE